MIVMSSAQEGQWQEPKHGQRLKVLRRAASTYILLYFWFAALVLTIATSLVGLSLATVAVPLLGMGALVTYLVNRAPDELATRLTLTIAINATWMLGLYVASDLHEGRYMLEIHMLYFINTAVVVSFACWRSVALTTVAALSHHLLLSIVSPALVWTGAQHAWIHLTNHAILGVINCAFGCAIAIAMERLISDLETTGNRAERRARHDALTGLLNRRGLQDSLDHLDSAKLADLTVMQIDLDGFKQINDTFGHGAGDAVLCYVGAQLCVLAPQDAIVSRTGGDEYLVVVPQASEAEIRDFVEALIAWAQGPFRYEDQSLQFGLSVGITSVQQSGADISRLLIDADLALNMAKQAGKNRAAWYNEQMRDQMSAAKALADDIRRGLDAGEFEPFFQTQHHALTGQIVGVEALARWRHPERGILNPSDFMGAVEAMGCSDRLDGIMLREAAQIVCDIESTGLRIPKLSVNVSFGRLRDPGLLAQVAELPQMLAKLSFEIVEAVFLDDVSEDFLHVLTRLREQGVGIEIDDFGTGHASIVALMRLGPDVVKIDRALVSPISHAGTGSTIVRSIVEMVRPLGIEVIAEGVERDQEITILRDMGVTTLQGFIYGVPGSAADLRRLLARRQVAA